MTAAEQAALIEAVASYDDLAVAVDTRALQIADQRRRTVRRRGWLVRRMLLTADFVGLVGAFLLAEFLAGLRAGASSHVGMYAEILLFLLTLPMWTVVAKLYGLYERDEERAAHSTVDDFVGVFHLVTVGTWIFLAATWVTRIAAPSLPKLLVFWVLAVGLVGVARAGARAVARSSETYIQNAIVVGAGEVGQLVAKTILQHPEY